MVKIKIIKIYHNESYFEEEVNKLLKKSNFVLDSIKVVGGTEYNAEVEQNCLDVIYIAIFKVLEEQKNGSFK